MLAIDLCFCVGVAEHSTSVPFLTVSIGSFVHAKVSDDGRAPSGVGWLAGQRDYTARIGAVGCADTEGVWRCSA